MGLMEYIHKRKFEITPEPKPGVPPEGERLGFVIHKHAARALHYDLRLELEGVLKSWAVPKGPSLVPYEKRLAVMVEDHPLEYRDFEGQIPEGSYGAGGVIIWDRGYYHHPSAHDGQENRKLLIEGLRKGALKFILEGERLHGEFALVRSGQGGKTWFLIKKKDGGAGLEAALRENRSVASQRSIEDILGNTAPSQTTKRILNRMHVQEVIDSDIVKGTPIRPMPHAIKPMLASTVRQPFDHPEWVFEVKWDGYRAIAEVHEGRVSLYSRNGIPFDRRFPSIAEELRRCGFNAVMDGEIVAVDARGNPDFQMLQHHRVSRGGHLLYYAFDLLYFQGHDLTGLSLTIRKDLLKKILPTSAKIRYSSHVVNEGTLFYNVCKEKGLEGIIAKHAHSTYEEGRRSDLWLKVKTRLSQEAVIAGYTEPHGNRENFGALVLGVFEGDEFRYIGHVGAGFTSKDLKEIGERMTSLVREECPFFSRPPTNAPATWIEPKVVCEVAFSGWTEDGIMRQPVFLRLRDDKTAGETRRETAAGSNEHRAPIRE